jgi:hypothetical protein
VNQQFRLPYDIKPFKDEVLCDIAPLEVCDVLLGQQYLWNASTKQSPTPYENASNLKTTLLYSIW